MWILKFECRGQWYAVNEAGEMTSEHEFPHFSGAWKFLGVSFHHWRNGIDVHFTKDTKAAALIGGRVWDLDHGSTRVWSGRYFGKLPRITRAYYTETVAD